jgi:hypothetical protein
MCWNLEVSLCAGVFAYTVAAFLWFSPMSIPRHKYWAGYLVGICSTQYVEAFLWYSGDLVKQCALGGGNHFGTQVLIPLALISQFMGSYLASRHFLPKWFSWWYAVFPCLFFGYHIPFWNANFASLFYTVTPKYCTFITPMGYLDWIPEADSLFLYLLYWAYMSAVPVNGMKPEDKWMAYLFAMYGLLCMLLSWTFTDSPGSNWCFYGTFYAVFFLLDFYATNHKRVLPRKDSKAFDSNNVDLKINKRKGNVWNMRHLREGYFAQFGY